MSILSDIKSLHLTYYGWHDLTQGLWIITEYFNSKYFKYCTFIYKLHRIVFLAFFVRRQFCVKTIFFSYLISSWTQHWATEQDQLHIRHPPTLDTPSFQLAYWVLLEIYCQSSLYVVKRPCWKPTITTSYYILQSVIYWICTFPLHTATHVSQENSG
jgi:hypothetical protein